jgi:hypothetical protein
MIIDTAKTARIRRFDLTTECPEPCEQAKRGDRSCQ